MNSLNILIIGFEPLCEKMYPHLYDVVTMLQRRHNVTYYGKDDRGSSLVAFGSHLYIPRYLKRIPMQIRGICRTGLALFRQFTTIRKDIKSIINEKTNVIIAIDHMALHHASRALKGLQTITLIFWSLDFISLDRDWYGSLLIRLLINNNKKDIKKCSFMIVQDNRRAAIIDSMLDSHGIPRLYLPVSLFDNRYARSQAKRRAKRNSNSNVILMQITASVDRGSDLLIQQFQKMSKNIILHIQGYISPHVHELIKLIGINPLLNPVWSSFNDMRRGVSDADIGFICYRVKDLNHHFISMASGQMVEFLRLGIPVVIMESEELGDFAERNGFGIFINDIESLEISIGKIVSEYGNYSRCARLAFERYYNIELYSKNLLKKIEQTCHVG